MPKELTSGAHAILMLTRMCKKVSVYGISSFHVVKQKVRVQLALGSPTEGRSECAPA